MSADSSRVKCTEGTKVKKRGQEAGMQCGHSLSHSTSSQGAKLVVSFCSEVFLSCIHPTAVVYVRCRKANSRAGEDGGFSLGLYKIRQSYWDVKTWMFNCGCEWTALDSKVLLTQEGRS